MLVKYNGIIDTNGAMHRTDWPSMKTLLGDASMTRRLLELDKSNVNEATSRRIKKQLEMPKFTPDEVRL